MTPAPHPKTHRLPEVASKLRNLQQALWYAYANPELEPTYSLYPTTSRKSGINPISSFLQILYCKAEVKAQGLS